MTGARIDAAVAAGHPATAAAGAEILAAGGTAADAAVAATLASCVAETVMTGLLGGGHGIYWDAASGRVRRVVARGAGLVREIAVVPGEFVAVATAGNKYKVEFFAWSELMA